jgi:RND family efflux transporter MFP subunit
MTQRALLLFALALPLTPMGCHRAQADQPDAASDASVKPHVVVTRPTAMDYRHELVLPATLEGFTRAELYVQVTGYIASVEVDIGDEVSAGDVLARISVPEMRADFKRAQAALDNAHAQITRTKEEQQLAALEKDRRAGLRAKEASAIAQADVDVAAAGEQIAQAEVAQARAREASAKAEIMRLKTLKGFSALRAPFSGRITRRFVHPGALARGATSNGARPVVELTQVNPLRVVVHLPEPLVPHVSVGHEVTIRVDARPELSLTGKVARRAGALDEATRSMRIEIDLLNDDGTLDPGMYAEVKVTATAIPGAQTLPSAALRGSGDERHVLVVRDGVVVRQAVQVIIDDGRRAVLGKGVGPQDRVVIAGSPLARDGVAVVVAEAEGK